MEVFDDFLALFSFDGRANRARYFWHVFLDDFIIAAASGSLVLVAGETLAALPLVGLILGGAWAATAVTVRRLHDLDRPGWHFFLFLIPFYNFYLALVLLFAKGTPGDNDYGSDPLERYEES